MQRHALLAQFEAAHFDEVLCDFGYALLAFMDREIRPVYQFSVNLAYERSEADVNCCKIRHACSSALE
jgi:hypothetical protein